MLWSVTDLSATEPVLRNDQMWQTVEIGRAGDISARLRVRKQASIDQEEWLVLEIENRSDQGRVIRHLHCNLNRKRFLRDSGQLVSSGGFASGGTWALFPKLHQEAHARRLPGLTIPPGVIESPRALSNSGACSLGLPPAEGWRVEGTVWFHLKTDLGETIRIDLPGIAFTFDWVPPDADGIKRMQATLRRLLTEQDDGNWEHQGYYVIALLRLPEVAKDLSTEELLEAVSRRSDGGGNRRYLFEVLEKYHADDPVVVETFSKWMDEQRKYVFKDLRSQPWIWDPAWVERFVRKVEQVQPSLFLQDNLSINILHAHRDTWPKGDVSQRLTAAILSRSDLPDIPLAEFDDQQSLIKRRFVECLG